ncbi:MAG: Rne/Rng family ribonuclease [Nitrospiraceae bacterium]|nr:MAG: Rne/Rng family ribonuclease [Nitrospiraceae bacterium]
MAGKIIINITPEQTRVALIENTAQLSELYIERKKDASLVGNVYKGKVVKILPGMQSAFVDIGLEKAAFLHAADVVSGFDYSLFGEDIDETVSLQLPIEDLLREGEEVFVQVAKDSIGSKGARVTSYITLPGRYLVLMPGVDHIGISRKIVAEEERTRLKNIVSELKQKNIGFIIRTASEECTEEELKKDIDYLMLLWENIQKKKEKVNAPHLLYSDLNLALRSVRDLLSQEIEEVLIDSKEEQKKLLDFVNTYFPKLISKIKLYESTEPVFDAFGVEIEIPKALGKRVWLKSGGYIVIDQTEALTSIDVNTGKFVGKASLEDTIFKTNLEAVKEIAYQIRLRNLGGIIIIDFIDMEKEENRKKLFTVFQEAMAKDRAKTTILEVSELGLIQMTRKRVRESLQRVLCEPCQYCDGKGFIKSSTTVCYEIFIELRRIALTRKNCKIMVTAHPHVADLIFEDEREGLEAIEKENGFKIILKADNTFHQEYFEVVTL